MALTNTKERYGSMAQILHWLTAVLIIGLLIAGNLMGNLPQDGAEEVAFKVFVYSMHKTLGVLVLLIAIVRVLWALSNTRPKPLHPERKLETFAAETVHWALYIAILAAPMTGLLHHAASTGFAPIWWPFGQDLPFVPKDENLSMMFGVMHWAMAVVIVLSLVAHIGGAIKHAVIDKDETLARMIPRRLPKGFSLSAEKIAHKSSKLTTLVAFIGVGGALVAAGGWSVSQQTEFGELKPLTIDIDKEREGDHPWKIIAEKSTLKIRVNQLGSPVEGAFENWDAQINLNPDNLDSAFVDARIDISSLSLGSVSDQAKSSDFLDVEKHAEARFLSDFFWLRGDGRIDAEGLLEIAGVKQPFTMTFSLVIDGDTAVMQSYLVLNRLDFSVGKEKYNNEDSVGFPVEVAIDIIAEKSW